MTPRQTAVFLFSGILFSLCVIAPVARAQQGREVVATVDNVAINAEEFSARLSLTVFPFKDAKRLREAVKLEFLYSLIGEILLAAEARRRGLEGEDAFRRSTRLAEEMLVRDKLYRDSVRSAVRVSDADVRARFLERQREVEYQFLFSESEDAIRGFADLVAQGVPFDTLLAAQQQSDAAGRLGEAPRGARDDVEPALRTAMARLRDGQISKPVRTPRGWYLLRKMARQTAIDAEDALLKSVKGIESELRRERETAAAKIFVKRLWKGRSATLTDLPYKLLGQRLWENVRRKARLDSSDVIAPDAELYDTLRAQQASRLDDTFASIGSDRVTLGETIDRLQKAVFRFPKRDVKRFPSLYRAAVYDLLDQWIITREGYRLGLENSPAVRNDLAMWAENGLSQALPDQIWEQFISSDDSLWAAYVRAPSLFGGPAEVKILEVLLADTAAAIAIEAESRAGASLRTLAKQFSVRPGAAQRNGELGFFPVTQYGAVGRRAFSMEKGDLSGIVRVPEGASVFELLDKRVPEADGVRNLDELRGSFEARSRKQLTQMKTDETVRKLAARARIQINEQALRAIDVEPLQMFTVRFLGFGGRIPAAPGVLPVYEAVMQGMAEKGMQAP
ncbi:MAG: peptidyl-prolyl cis-trans isomerase [Ignavibacteria bacterium]|nr:peptidyl-prolyl cis-trans isomerase [Ignavibacteria bacterium]